MTINTNAWEFETEDQALLALAGNVSRDVYQEDRRRRAEQVRAVCRVAQDRRGFEIGSGDGTVARILAAQCTFLDCCDVSASFLTQARRNCRDVANIGFHEIRSASLDLPDAAYDFGFSLNVFIHLNPYDMYLYLSEVRRCLRPGGVFYFDACTLSDPTRDLFHEHAQYFKERPADLRGFLSFNHPDLIRAIVDDVGLRVDQSASSTDAANGWLQFLLEAPHAAR